MDLASLRSRRQERGNVLIVAIIGVMLAFSMVLWVSELSLRNFQTTDRHVYREDAFFAAQGAADALVAEFKLGFDKAKQAAPLESPPNFIDWLETSTKWKDLKQALPTTSTDVITSSIDVPEWQDRSFNGATITRARITRTTVGTYAAGYTVTLRIDVEASPLRPDVTDERLTVTRLFSATNATEFKGGDFALLTENISCTFCHLTVSTMELKKKMEEPDILTRYNSITNKDESHYRRALVGTTKYLNTRFDGSDTEIHGTLYVGQGVTVADHGKPSTLKNFAEHPNKPLRMAELHNDWDEMESDNVVRSTFQNNGTGKAKLSSKPSIAADNNVKGAQLYDQYPGYGDYKMDKTFPSPFKDEGDENAVGAHNRRIDPIELAKTQAEATGTLQAKHYTRVAYNTDEEYTNKNYTYNDTKLPELDSATPVETFKTGEKSNLILIGTKDNPIRIDGNVVIEGDVVIKGYVEGKGLLKATGNVYIPSDVMYNNKDVGTANEVFSKDTTIGIASGGNIIIGDYISKVWGSNADFDEGKYDGGTPATNPNFVTYAAEQIAIYNREELTRTLKKVPTYDDKNLADTGSYDSDNPVYDEKYTPRYYTMYPDTPAYAFIKDGGKGARYDINSKSWQTGEAPTNYNSHHMKIEDVPANIKNGDVTPRVMSIHPNWISPQNMLEIIGNEERTRLKDAERNQKPFRIDGLLYTNNAIISIQRKRSQTQKDDGTGWQENSSSSHRGKMEINGSIIAPDLGMLVTNGFNVNYDRRVRNLLNEKVKTPDWFSEVRGFSRFNGPMAP